MLARLLHGDGTSPAQLELVARAHEVAAALGERAPSGRVVLSCKHADSFVPGLLGAWLSGHTVELLPNVQPGTLDRVDADPAVTHVLHDVATTQQRSRKAIYLPDLVAGPATPRPAAWPEVALHMTTSGTTERPKPVLKKLAQLLDELDVLATVIAPARCVLSTVPLSHLYGLLFGALLPLRFGARIVSHEALLPADIAAIIERDGVDLMISTPAHLRAMANADMPRGLRVISSGARMPAEVQMRLASRHGWRVTDVLGSTETGGIGTRQDPMAPWTPLPGVSVSAPRGQLVVESPWCDGSRAELDDRIELRPGGAFMYVGRNIELVKIGGKRAHAHELEATVRAIPGVIDAAVLVHAVAGKEGRVALAVVCESAVDRDQIGAAIRTQFDAVFVPKIIKVVDKIPRTDRGKLDSETLRDQLGLGPGPVTDQIPAQRVGPGEYAAEIPTDLVFFRGHFDAFTILPGAVIVERLVWPVVKQELPAVRALRKIGRLRFRRPVLPGQQVAIHLSQDSGSLTFKVSCGSDVVASGQLVVD